MKAPLTKFVLAALLASAGVSALLPTAAAQAPAADCTVQLEITPYDAAIQPLSDLAVISVAVKYTYNAYGISLIATPVQLSVTEAPPWASITISPATVLIPTDRGATPGPAVSAPTQTARVLVATTSDAPAFTPSTLKIKAVAQQNGDVKSCQSEEPTQIRAGYFSIIDAVPQTTIQLATPQSQVAYPVTVTNYGNADTKIFFRVTSKPESWQVVEPTPTTLQSRQAGGKNIAQTINLMIQTPFRNGYLNEVGAVAMEITSSYALDSKVKGDTTALSTLTTTRGFYVPGVEPFLLLAAVGGLAVVLRRRL